MRTRGPPTARGTPAHRRHRLARQERWRRCRHVAPSAPGVGRGQVRLPCVERHPLLRSGVCEQLGGVEHHRVQPLRLLAPIVSVGVGEHVDPVHTLHRADPTGSVRGEAGVVIDVPGPGTDAVADPESGWLRGLACGRPAPGDRGGDPVGAEHALHLDGWDEGVPGGQLPRQSPSHDRRACVRAPPSRSRSTTGRRSRQGLSVPAAHVEVPPTRCTGGEGECQRPALPVVVEDDAVGSCSTGRSRTSHRGRRARRRPHVTPAAAPRARRPVDGSSGSPTPIIESRVTSSASRSSLQPSVPAGAAGSRDSAPRRSSPTRGPRRRRRASTPNSASTPRGSRTARERYGALLYHVGGRPSTGHG